jgi:hypothetical protein
MVTLTLTPEAALIVRRALRNFDGWMGDRSTDETEDEQLSLAINQLDQGIRAAEAAG